MAAYGFKIIKVQFTISWQLISFANNPQIGKYMSKLQTQ